MRIRVLASLVLTGGLICVSSFGASPIISEFTPSNARILADEDGQFPDWLEIHNPGDAPLQLRGFYLTDSSLILTNWAFPSVTLAPRGYLVVFASGKNRTNDPAHLHTSFQLSAGGGYLALVAPDGTTVLSSFSSYPSVKEDVSFGTAQSLVTSSLLASSIPRILVPTNAAGLPVDWNSPLFVPGGNWLTGAVPPAIGYDTNQVAAAPVNVARSGTAVQSTTEQAFTPNLALNGNLADFTHTLGSDPAPFWQVTLTNEMAIFSVVLFNRTSCCGSRLRDITIEILSTNETGTVTNYASTLLNPENILGSYPGGPAYLSNNLVSITGGPVSGRFVRVRRTPDPDLSGSGGQGNADEGAVLSLGEVVINATAAAGLRPFFTTDLTTNMFNVTPSAFVRVPFTASSVPDTLTLNVRYDDGFVAFLNGVEVVRRNAPGTLEWNSTATQERNFASATALESIDISTVGIPALSIGNNVLAIQIMNWASSNGDLLFQPELVASRTVITTNVFFDDPTPGSANTTDWYYDEVKDTSFSVDRGFFDAPFTVSIASDTPDAAIYYSFNGDEPGPGKGNLYTGPITITNTTVLRTRAIKADWKSTDVDTATYIFIADVIRQVPNWPQDRIPPQYFPATWGGNAVDYGMDPEIVTNFTLAQWREALTQVPTMSIVTEMRHLFDATTGIYANASQHGELWERPVSLELIEPTNAVPGRFQENCGLRIRGGFSRNADFRKHSLRVFFRREYGAGKLNYPLFENDGAQDFETFDLRTSQNYSWPRGTESPTFETMVREVWSRQTLGAMGQPYRRSRYYHLYLNGQYWGLYETDERPEASYGESYFGGQKENFDVVKCGNRGTTPNFATEATDGNLLAWTNLWVMTQIMRTNAVNSNYFRIIGCDTNGVRDPNLPVMLDVDNLIDYMLGIFFTGDGDATLSSFLGNNMPNNWFGMRDRTNPNVGFRFFNSDCEHTMGSPSSQVDRTGPFPNSNETNFVFSNPQWMHEELSRNPEYRIRFADHVQKHFFNGGALTLQACTNRFIAKAVQINRAIRAYSARWGDANSATTYGEAHWTNAINFVLNWFPTRGTNVLAQLRRYSYGSLFPTVGAPSLSQFGGTVPDGYNLELSHTNASGVIYFTLDGSDPRLVGGGVAPQAQSYSQPIVVTAPTLVRARVLTGGNWSPIVEVVLHPPQNLSKLQITEVMYNPPAVGLVDGDEFEFLELKNTGTTGLNLSNLRFVNGITFTFPNGTFLGPQQFFVLVRNSTQFAAKYPGVTFHGVYNGRLDNAGESLLAIAPSGGRILSLDYDDRTPWPVTPDGFGFSLVSRSPNPEAEFDGAHAWRASAFPGGSPGADDPEPGIPPVVINEALTATVLPDRDTIELFNPTPFDVNIAGWFLTDEPDTPKKFQIPIGSVITNGSYLVFNEAQFNPAPGTSNSFSLRAEGDDLYLFSADSNGNLTGYSHGFSFGAAERGVTFGRYVLSTGDEDFPAQLNRSLGGGNPGPRIGPVVINEIHYHPDTGDDEFIELKNITGESVPLFDPANPTNEWRVNGLSFTFPTNLTLGSNGLLVIASTAPAAFRAKYLVPPSVTVLGPYSGLLQDSGERLELQRPGPPDTNSSIAYIDVDAVRYNDRAPWPPVADGSGPSLQRKNALAYGNDPINWEGALPTPGRNFVGGQPPFITSHPSNVTVVATREALFNVSAAGPAPLYFQWRFNGSPILNATNSSLFLTNLQFAQAGNYTALVYNEGGFTESFPAQLNILTPASITRQPTNISVKIRPDPGAPAVVNVNFDVAATSTTPVRYQWSFNGLDILNATNTQLTVTNVQLSSEGFYRAAITDGAGTIFSAAAYLQPLITPVFVVLPVSQHVPINTPVTLSAEVFGHPPPFTFDWRRGSLPLALTTTVERVGFFTFISVSVPQTNQYRVVVKNAANPNPGVPSPLTNIVTLADSDSDGMPDAWENMFGFNPTNSIDRNVDGDGDGMSNWAEFIAGTDATNALSYLKLDLDASGGPAIVFNAVSNRTYAVQFAEGLGGPWLPLAGVTARLSNRVETVQDPNYSTNRFYRLVTPRQP